MVAGGSRARLLALVTLCSLLARPQPSRAFLFFGGVRSRSTSVPQGGNREEKVPMTVVSSDYSPRPAPLGPSPSAAPVPTPAPVRGSDGEDEDGTPRLPSERRRGHSSGDHGAAAQAPAAGATSADFISSSPTVPLPAGVTDSATVLPMPSPGRQQQRRDDAGMGALQLQVRVVQLTVPLLMMVSFGALL
nr:unnamed protein product [Digitaria exilis]